MGILRNLSYRLDSEVSPEHKYGQTDDWRSKGLGGGQFKRKEMGDDIVKKKKNRFVLVVMYFIVIKIKSR